MGRRHRAGPSGATEIHLTKRGTLPRLAAAACARGLSCRLFRRFLAGNGEQHFALALDTFLAALRLRLLFAAGLLGTDALAQGIHEIDNLGRLAAFRRLDLDALRFLLISSRSAAS